MKYIFQIKIKPGQTTEEYVKAWKEGSSIIQKSTGAKGTRLYQKSGDPTTLLAIAEWESKEARDVGMKKLKEEGSLQDVLNKHSEFGEITSIGSFEETDWEVIF